MRLIVPQFSCCERRKMTAACFPGGKESLGGLMHSDRKMRRSKYETEKTWKFPAWPSLLKMFNLGHQGHQSFQQVPRYRQEGHEAVLSLKCSQRLQVT